jgi:hypothetical protein
MVDNTKFPAWVEGPPRQPVNDEERARNRLRYLVLWASLQCTSAGSIASLADHCGIQRTQIHEALREGKFSAKMAADIERKCGRKVVRREWLIFPLEIEELV